MRARWGMAGPDTNNTETLPYPIWGFGPPASEPDTKKLDALLASLNGSAERFQTLWFSFLGLTLYLAITALATTHRMLLLGEPQTLPILNIKVELLPFYIIAPLLYLIFHFYLLMMLALLARTAAEFDKQLRSTLPGEPERERYRAQVGNSLFLQSLVGMKSERTGVYGVVLGVIALMLLIAVALAPPAFPLALVGLLIIVIAPNALLLGIVAFITTVLAPLATLVLIQMMFLPYHSFRITWWHRGIVVLDLVLILAMTYRWYFPRGFKKAPLVLDRLRPKPRWVTAMASWILVVAAVVPLAYWLSFDEGRWAGEPRASSITEWAGWMKVKPPQFTKTNPDYAATAKGVVFGLFPDRLELDEQSIVGAARLDETKKEIAARGGDFVPTINLDGRDLQAAKLGGADLRGISLEGSLMQDADLAFSRLDAAHLFRASLRGANLFRAQLQGADLRGANLEGATLEGAQMQSAGLFRAQLQEANLAEAGLQGADLTETGLQGADLHDAQAQVINLSGARLLGANLNEAQLQGAKLRGAQIQSANLVQAQLQGATLYGAQMQGSNLMGAQLQAADLGSVQLQGGNLSEAGAQGANFSLANLADCVVDKTFVSRANSATAQLETAAIESVDITEVKTPDVDSWVAAATQFADADEKDEILVRFSRLKVDAADQDAANISQWRSRQDSYRLSDPVGEHHRQRLAKFIGDLACKTSNGPYVVRGLVRWYPWASLRDQLKDVRKRLKDGRERPDICGSVAGFTEDDWRALDSIKPD